MVVTSAQVSVMNKTLTARTVLVDTFSLGIDDRVVAGWVGALDVHGLPDQVEMVVPAEPVKVEFKVVERF